ncbi:hypothetical protein G5V58_01670 [Nocardioides anomalus]|uniref:FtsX-like permease family protein n=1 Tax=Nocardioides anomalus TaxID=2712223 RepID=A0A6G6W8W5_9ACTN|nr:hypothetical protein [Nocardioides anomalus]QIG41649.1 hypothetical protein G5V58_01670 [Nocardioides anomalus]
MTVLRASGRARAGLVVASTAVASGLLLVAASYARLSGWGGYNYDPAVDGNAPLLGPIADPGTRGGAIFAAVLMTVPVVLLLDQCVRLGSAAQRRRYRALAVAGATRRDLRQWGAVETGGPALLGAVVGVGVWLILRYLLGTVPASSGQATLVPTATGPGWWALLVVALVTAYGVLVGRRAASAAAADRRPARRSRPWGPVLLVAAVIVLVTGGLTGGGDPASTVIPFVLVAVAVIGIVLSTPWLAFVLAGRAARRAEHAAVLLAARRIRADHGAAGRAAAAVGAVGLALGVTGTFVTDVLTSGSLDVGYYVGPAILVALLAMLALGLITLSLSLHSIESTLARRRAVSALAATGTPVSVLEDAHREECRMVTLPLTVGAALLGAFVYALTAGSLFGLLGGLVTAALAALAVRLAIRVVPLATRPYLHAAVDVTNLRTE